MITWKTPIVPELNDILKRIDHGRMLITITSPFPHIQVRQDYRCICGEIISYVTNFDPSFFYHLPNDPLMLDALATTLERSLATFIKTHLTSGHPVPTN